MPVDAAKAEVIHNSKENRFEIRIEDEVCVLEYQLQGQTIFFTHTEVPQALEGQGLAGRLAKTGLDYARQNSLRVVPACEFMHVYIKRHPEYEDLLRKP